MRGMWWMDWIYWGVVLYVLCYSDSQVWSVIWGHTHRDIVNRLRNRSDCVVAFTLVEPGSWLLTVKCPLTHTWSTFGWFCHHPIIILYSDDIYLYSLQRSSFCLSDHALGGRLNDSSSVLFIVSYVLCSPHNPVLGYYPAYVCLYRVYYYSRRPCLNFSWLSM